MKPRQYFILTADGQTDTAERSMQKLASLAARHRLQCGLKAPSQQSSTTQSKDLLDRLTRNHGLPPSLAGLHVPLHDWALASYRPWMQLALSLLSPPGKTTGTQDEFESPKWILDRPGWVRYPHSGTSPSSASSAAHPVPYPKEPGLILDVEVLTGLSRDRPVLAVAWSPKAWYCWLSPVLFSSSSSSLSGDALSSLSSSLKKEQKKKMVEKEMPLIPLGAWDSPGPRLVVGHHVGYDRARILDEYRGPSRSPHSFPSDSSSFATCGDPGIRYLDTMALHVAVAGLTAQQRNQWMRMQKVQTSSLENAPNATTSTMDDPSQDDPFEQDWDWFHQSALNSLQHLAQFYLNHPLDKDQRSLFIHGTLDDVRRELKQCVEYCAKDVWTTHRVFQRVFPLFLERKTRGDLISFGGMLEMGSCLYVSLCFYCIVENEME